MSEEQVVQATEVQAEQVEGTEGSTTQQEDPIQKRAIEMGWRPKEEFDGDDVEFIPAEEFVRRKPLFDKIEHQSKELKDVKKVLRSLQDHHVKVKETEFQRAVDFLKVQKKQAYEEGDTDRIIEIDEQMSEMRESKRQQAQQVNAVDDAKQIHPEFASWVSQNNWYSTDKSLRNFADSLGVSHAKDNPDLSPAEVLKYVTKTVKQTFKEKFENPNKIRAAAVDGGTSSTKVSTGNSSFSLTEDETRVMNQFVRAGILTKEQYIADVKSMRGNG
jgi:hypothetical protein